MGFVGKRPFLPRVPIFSERWDYPQNLQFWEVDMDTNGIEKSVLTERQRFWLEHWQRCQATPGTIKAYALAHELSLPAMYFWRRELIAYGLLEGARRRVRFRKLAILSDARPSLSAHSTTTSFGKPRKSHSRPKVSDDNPFSEA